jgi:hypothetical protein
LAGFVESEAEDAEELFIFGAETRDAAVAVAAPDAALVDIAEQEIAGAFAGDEAFDETRAAGELDENVGGALRLAVGGEGGADRIERGRALERGEVGVAFDGSGDAEGGQAAERGERGVGLAGEGLGGGEVVEVTRRIGTEREGGGVGVAGGGEIFALVSGFGGATEVDVGRGGSKREGEKERRGEQK